MRDRIVWLRHRPSVLYQLLLGLPLGGSLTPNVKHGRCVGEVHRSGGRHEKRGEEATQHVERDRARDDYDVQSRARGEAQGG